MLTKFQKIYSDYPRLFWIVVGVSFIDGIGGTLLFPFFASTSRRSSTSA